MIGYQYATPDEFYSTSGIEGPYVDGVSITHGEPGARAHIWTYSEKHGPEGCGTAPSFVGNDYFCDRLMASPPGVTAPWFCRQLPQTTTDDIEVRICGDEGTDNEDTPVEIIELYIR